MNQTKVEGIINEETYEQQGWGSKIGMFFLHVKGYKQINFMAIVQLLITEMDG